MAASQGRLWLLQERLKQERLFVTKEKECIRQLNSEIQSACEKLFHISWITAQQWKNLQRLQAHPAKASYANKLLDSAEFVDAYKTLGRLESQYGDFLKSLRENPSLIASSLAFIDQIKVNIDTKQVARLLLNSLYGNCLLPEDENYVLIIMRSLMEFQILKSEQPHAFLRSPRNWSFTVVFGLLIESLFSAKLYLTAALHTPILHVLTKDSKIQAQLPYLCTRFVQSLQEKLYCFPPSLRWLICQLFKVLTSSGILNVNQSKAMVSELLFNYLVCPAIINPEPYGINSNMQVSKIARLNLQQISSLLCKRCTSPWEQGSLLNTDDMFNTVEVKYISSLVDCILEGVEYISDIPEQHTLPGLCRTSVLITDNELQSLVTYLKMIHCWDGDIKFPHLRELGDLLDLLPPEKEGLLSKHRTHSSPPVINQSPSASPKVPHKTKKRLGKQKSKPQIELPGEEERRENFTSLALAYVVPTVSKAQAYQQECVRRLGQLYQEHELVSVIPLSYTCIESPGMLPEEKVLGIEKPKPTVSSKKPPMQSSSDSGQSIRQRSNSNRFTKLFHNLSIEKELNKKDLGKSSSDIETSGDHLQTIIGSPSEASEVHSMAQPNSIDVVPQTTSTAVDHLGPDLVEFDATSSTNTQVDLLICFEDNRTAHQPSTFNQTFAASTILDAPLVPSQVPALFNLSSSGRDSTISSGSSARASTLSSLSSGTRDSTLDNDMESLEGQNVLNWSHDQTPVQSKDNSGSLTVVLESSLESNRESFVYSLDESLPDSTKSDSSSSVEDYLDSRESYETKNRKPAKKSGSIKRKLKKARTLGLEKFRNRKDGSRPKSMPESELVKSERKGSGLMKHLRKRDRSHTKQSGAKVYQKIDDSLDLFATHPTIPQSQVEAAEEKTPKDIIEGLISKYQEMANKAMEDTADQDVGQEESDEEDGEDIDEETRFDDTKRKLRLVLNQADFQNLPWLVSKERVVNTSTFAKSPTGELMTFLHVQLAEAINLQNRSLAAQLHETIRSVKQLSPDSCAKLLDSIESEYEARMPYLAYLTRSRQTLLTTQSHFEQLIERVQKNQMLCQKCFTTSCITLFLEVREGEINSFITNFRSPDVCPTVDEKCKHVDNFLEKLHRDLVKDETWLGATEEQLEDGRIAIERDIMAHIYTDAFYPNGQIDMERDKAFTKHVEMLQKEVGITHKAIRIPKLYRKEAPWPSAQQELSTINAYKTPKDKLKCVQRCCFTIMNLLNMACTTNSCEPAGADEFVPALVCVVINSNPPSLLSTIQYVSNFYGQRLSGEEAWSWMQLCAAIEYTKTIKV